MSGDRRPEQSLGHWAARLSWAARGAMERRLKILGVSPPMMAALLAVDGGCARAADVAEYMGVDAAAVTRLLDRLAEAGLVERCELEGDRRSRKISLSPTALALLPKLRAVGEEVDGLLSEGLSNAKKQELMAALKALTHRAEQL